MINDEQYPRVVTDVSDDSYCMEDVEIYGRLFESIYKLGLNPDQFQPEVRLSVWGIDPNDPAPRFEFKLISVKYPW